MKRSKFTIGRERPPSFPPGKAALTSGKEGQWSGQQFISLPLFIENLQKKSKKTLRQLHHKENKTFLFNPYPPSGSKAHSLQSSLLHMKVA